MGGPRDGGDLITLVALIIAIGVATQLLAARFHVPSVVFLITAGIGIGLGGLGLVTQDVFGGTLPTIVRRSVAIIVYEGAFDLAGDRIR